MIEVKNGTAYIQCDFCSHVDEYDIGNYHDRKVGWKSMVEWMKKQGWLSRCWGTVWKHTCPTCIENDNKEMHKGARYQHND